MFQVIFLMVIILGLAACNPVDNNSYLPPNQAGPAIIIPTNDVGAAAAAAVAGAYSSANVKQVVPIVKFSTDNDGRGTYSYSYEAANGIVAEEKGDATGDGTKARGSYGFTLPDGQRVSLTYTADENGFVAQGSHIPTPGPIPDAILRALEENAAAEARGIFDDGQYHGEGLEESQYKEGVEEGESAKVQSPSVANEGYKY